MADDRNTAPRPLVVGVGASAGGLDALLALLKDVPAGQGVAFVVVFHLDPAAKALLPELLAKAGPYPVVEAADGTPVEADRIYTAPGHSLVAIEGGVLRLTPPGRPEDRRTVVDRFLTSLARDQGDRAVAVVLSGAGSDGSLGLTAVADAGGLAMVQDPATARHDSMPLTAADAGAADHVLPPEGLARELLAHARHLMAAAGPGREADLFREVSEALPQVCEVLLAATGHNFKHYKTSTLTRRTLRRVQVLRADSAAGYVARLRADPAEADRLFKELLINVTAFFRDPEAFAALDAEVLPKLFAGRPPGDPVRLWVPGCATGEEAYSLAMLLRERLDAEPNPPEVQIFATDIDEAALAAARAGAYPLGVADEVPAERLRRFFVKKGQHYHVAKEVRELVLFSTHNLINDPPFSRLDLVSCRNLLIYLGSHLQKKLIPLFHYALRPGGYLFLGPSESLDAHRELFRAVDAKSRISQRLPTAIRPAAFLGERTGPPSAVRPPNAPAPVEADTYLVMQRIVLDEFAPKAVVVNEEGQVVCASGNLEKYLAVSAGAFHNSLTRLVREGLGVGVRAALADAARVRRKVVHDGMSVRSEAGVQRVMVTVQPMPQMGADSGLFMVVFQDVGRPLAPDAPAEAGAWAGRDGESAAALIEQLERELASTRDDLEKTVQDLEAANEELKSSNEELLSMNEELQSSNEELETSKEEVQAANDSLAGLNEDLENLLASTRIATLFLDDAGVVRRATPAAAAVYNILPTDAGRPLAHFTHQAAHMPPLPPPADVHRGGWDFVDDVEMRDGTWYQRRVLPYVTAEGTHEGVVVTFTDMTERKRAEAELFAANERLNALMTALPVGVSFSDDVTCERITGNPALQRQFSITPADNISASATDPDAAGRKVRFFRDGREVTDAELPLQRAVAENRDIPPTELLVELPDGRRWWTECGGAPLRDHSGAVVGGVAVTVDVTDRKRAEEDRREAAARLRFALDSAKIGDWDLDLATDTARTSQRHDACFGHAAPVPGWGFARFMGQVHPDDRAAVERRFREAAAGDADWGFECRVVWPDDTVHWIEAHGSVYLVGGQPARMLGIVQDVTERKLAEEAVRGNEKRLAEVFDLAPSFMCILKGPGHVFEMANEQYHRLVGRRQLVGQPLLDAMPELAGQPFPGLLDAVYRTGEPFVGTDVPAVVRRGAGAPVELSIDFVYLPLRGPDGAVEGVLCHGVDLTERKGAERELARLAAESERQRRVYDAVLSNTVDYHFVMDRDGRFTFANRALLALWGKADLAEAAGKTPRELDYPDDLGDRLAAQARQVIDTRAPLRAETPYVPPGGSEVRNYEYFMLPVFGAGGEVEAAAGSSRDVTDRKRVEDALRDADRRKDEFLATLAHELRNPLAPIRNGLQVLKMAGSLPTAAESARAMMERQLAQMVRLVDDLLDVSRINSGKLELRRERVELAAVVRNAVETSRPLIDRHGHELSIDLPAEPVVLDADPVRLAQVLLNLLNNAAKYSESGGRIWLTAEVAGGEAVVRVRDAGIGIAPGHLAQVFEMFAQVQTALEKSQGGLGIGLSLVKGLVAMHGGTVEVASGGPGRGSEFTVRLPLADADAGPPPPEAGPGVTERPAGRRVLVVDDNVDSAESLCEVLALAGHDVRTAHDGAAGVAAAAEFRPGVILLDLGMPKLNGFEAARAVRAEPWGAAVVLVALTGWGAAEDRRKTRDAGFDHHLVKPVDPAALLKLLAGLPAV